jgi:hypothetical protein
LFEEFKTDAAGQTRAWAKDNADAVARVREALGQAELSDVSLAMAAFVKLTDLSERAAYSAGNLECYASDPEPAAHPLHIKAQLADIDGGSLKVSADRSNMPVLSIASLAGKSFEDNFGDGPPRPVTQGLLSFRSRIEAVAAAAALRRAIELNRVRASVLDCFGSANSQMWPRVSTFL